MSPNSVRATPTRAGNVLTPWGVYADCPRYLHGGGFFYGGGIVEAFARGFQRLAGYFFYGR